MQKAEIIKLFAIIASEFGDRFQTSPEKVELWGNILGHATYQEAQQAVFEILGSPQQFPPVAGQINERVLSLRSGAASLDWANEWSWVLLAASNANYNAQSEAQRLKPATLAAIGGVAGLKELALATPLSLTTHRAQFRARFDTTTKKAVENEFRDHIEGKTKELLNMAKMKVIK